MRSVGIAALTATALIGAPAAAEDKIGCVKANDERVIEVISPGEIGEMCDVRYSRDGGAAVSAPYHADNSQSFCQSKAKELAEKLTASGYVCAPLAVGEAKSARSATREVATAPLQQAPSQPPSTVASSAARTAPQAETATVESAAPAVGNAIQKVAADSDLENQMRQILAEPPIDRDAASDVSPTEAVRGPAQLAAFRSPNESESRMPQSQSAHGRLIGAAPEPAPQAAVAATPASAQSAALTQHEPTSAPAAKAVAIAPSAPQSSPAPESTKAPSSSKTAARRKPAEIIRATLNAQAAAWNEGNLEAFMESYWRSDDLKFVSGGDITKGWSATMKRYRDRYGDDRGLGQLGFSKLDVQMITDDVAVVTGRFQLIKDERPSSGVFSLVMRQDSGVWRIVHDHTVGDPTTAE